MNSSQGSVILATDTGGTFTDLVAIDNGQVHTAKVPTTPQDPAIGVLQAVAVSGASTQIQTFAHGMTVGTNALLTRTGAKTALVVTAGFTGLLEIGRQNRPALYDLSAQRVPPLVPLERVVPVAERIGPKGEVLLPLTEEAVVTVVEQLRQIAPQAVAVCLLHSYRNPVHEQQLGAALRAGLPDIEVSLSCEVQSEFREYERCSTVAVNAYLNPCVAAYLDRLDQQAQAQGLPAPLINQSNGGLATVPLVRSFAVRTVLSGPAGGAVGAAYIARLSGFANILAYDVGGTSTDCSLVLDGRLATRTEATVAGCPIRAPQIDIHTVAAGGGSIAYLDSGGLLQVGPQSAGAVPGPICYGRGGTAATVTDASLVLGYLAADASLGTQGQIRLNRQAAEQAISQLGEPLGLDWVATAGGILRINIEDICQALRLISIQRGIDPRELALLAFGGAGALSACAVATELGMTTVLVPRWAGVLSALGMAIADQRQDLVYSRLYRSDQIQAEEIERIYAELASRASLGQPDQRQYEFSLDMRYLGQSHELTVPIEVDWTPGQIAAAFHQLHQLRRHHSEPDQPVEFVNFRLSAVLKVPKPTLVEPAGTGAKPIGQRPVWFEGQFQEIAVYDRTQLGQGDCFSGPAIVQMPESTAVIAPGWQAEIDTYGTLVLRNT
ncbi:hydantoinase/oxoprolinase family protein [Leptolyngbya sp. FACHB-261]|uniref:hydantoinase/oxoprolinase family protein n=1 Tax=Leptolyngbya sp. FACHB-261 TaxID=2692806 RepID=UPI001682E07C|nr:hydantoinase/oxoprolinase family protein [Leptolyngbya sp. FACHB-261]MBD2103730.1 hydantoinase/oxoprolinase family protein [Leptolyngbya sp. FACHB-261]